MQAKSIRQAAKMIGQSLISICVAILAGALIILAVGENPITAFGELLRGAFGNKTYLANTISRAVPLIFTGLSVALSLRCGMFNIGAEGQLYLGAMTVAILGLYMENIPLDCYSAFADCWLSGWYVWRVADWRTAYSIPN